MATSVRFGTVTVALSGMFGPVFFLLYHLRFFLSCKPLSSALETLSCVEHVKGFIFTGLPDEII